MTTHPKLSPESQQLVQAQAQMLSKFLRDGQQILSFLLASALMLALISHDLEDGGWSITAVNTVPQNWLGTTGVYLSDLLLSMMGYAAYWLPLTLYYKVLRYLLQRYDVAPALAQGLDSALSPPRTWVASSAFILLLIATALLAGLHFYHPDHGLPHAVGGIVGESLTLLLLNAVGVVVATLLALGLWLIGITFSLGLSWLRLMDEIGFYTEQAALRLFRWGQTESRESKAGLPENYAVDDQLSPFAHFAAEEEVPVKPSITPEPSKAKTQSRTPPVAADSAPIQMAETSGTEDDDSSLYAKDEETEPTQPQSRFQRYWQQFFKGSSVSERQQRFDRVEPDFSLETSITFDASTFAEPKLSEFDLKADPASDFRFSATDEVLETSQASIPSKEMDSMPKTEHSKTVEPDHIHDESPQNSDEALQQALTQLIQQQSGANKR